MAKSCKQPQCPSVGDWIKNLAHPHNEILGNKKESSIDAHNNVNESTMMYLVKEARQKHRTRGTILFI